MGHYGSCERLYRKEMIVRPGKHRFTPPMWGPAIGGISRWISFDASCRYDLGGPDQQDWNKLIGVCGWRGPHYNSYRFAWRYNQRIDLIELSAYVYIKGKRHIYLLGQVSIDLPMNYEIRQHNGMIQFVINGNLSVQLPGRIPYIGWKLGPYFGGNNPAPHQMKISCTRISRSKN